MTSEFKRELAKMTNGHCSYCGRKFQEDEQWEMDHVVPRSRGGAWKGNLTPACRRCNQRKGAYTPEEFRAWLKKKAYKVTVALLPGLEEFCQFVPDEDARTILNSFSSTLDCIAETEIIFFLDEHPRG